MQRCTCYAMPEQRRGVCASLYLERQFRAFTLVGCNSYREVGAIYRALQE